MGTLFDADDSVLVVIDVQPGFLRKLTDEMAAQVVERVCFLVGTARALGIPIVATEEEPDRHGATLGAVVGALPAEHPRHRKPTFGLAFSPSILAAVESTGRRSAVLCGLETDVCVAQSAIGLHDLGWKVAVVADAVGAAGTAHDQGLRRIEHAGISLIGLKGLRYEWISSVDRLSLPGLPKDAPAGITL